MKVTVVSKPNIVGLTQLYAILEENSIDIAQKPDQADLIIAYGGDGTVLHAIDQEKPILPVRAATSLGYIHDISLQQFREAAPNLKDRTIQKYPLLEVPNYPGKAASEISIKPKDDRAIKVNVYHNGELLLKEVNGDGILVCTPLGSTGYNFSAGGPITILSDNITLTLNNSHSHRKRSYVFPPEDKIEIEAIYPAQIIYDGKTKGTVPIEANQKVTIQVSQSSMKLVKIPGFEENPYKKLERFFKCCSK